MSDYTPTYYGRIYIAVKDDAARDRLMNMRVTDKRFDLKSTSGKALFGNMTDLIWCDENFSMEWYYVSSLAGVITKAVGNDSCIVCGWSEGGTVSANDDEIDVFLYAGAKHFTRSFFPSHEEPSFKQPEAWLKWAHFGMTTEIVQSLYNFGGKFDFVKKYASVKKGQKTARLFISVKDPALWKMVAALDLSDPAYALPASAQELFGDLHGTDFKLDHDWPIEFGFSDGKPMKKLIMTLRKAMKADDFVVVADCSDYDCSPVYETCSTLDGKMTVDLSLGDLSMTEIDNVEDWMRFNKIKLNVTRTQRLASFPSPAFNFAKRAAGIPVAQSDSPAASVDLSWMKGKNFVLTGFSDADEAAYASLIESNGGVIRSSTVLDTNYLVYDPAYGKETTKLKRAKELIAKGKLIELLTRAQFDKRTGGVSMKAPPASNQNGSVLRIPKGTKQIKKGEFKERFGITKVVIPDSVTVIGENAFSRCPDLEEVVFPAGLKKIKKGAFYRCTNLKRAILPDGVESIGENAFNACKAIEEVYLGTALRELGSSAFQQCITLTQIRIPDGVGNLSYKLFSGCKNLKSVTFGSGISSIGYYCFAGCVNLTSVTIPNGVTSIGDYAFDNCKKLTNVTIPGSVTIIDAWAFRDCKKLTNVTIPDSVTSIGWGAFENCTKLTSVTIPDSVTDIGQDAFSNTAWYNAQPDGLVYAGKVAYKYKGTMPSGTSIVLKVGTKGIADAAFWHCAGLTNLVIPDGMTRIAGSITFSGCENLESVTIPDSVTEIASFMFRHCTKLESVTIPDSVAEIGYHAFPAGIIIRAHAGSYAEEYAKKSAAEFGYKFEAI